MTITASNLVDSGEEGKAGSNPVTQQIQVVKEDSQ
jgi:hypothetical protein